MTLVDLLQSSSSHADFSSPGASSYLDQLLSLSLHELLRQPTLISAEASTVESDLTNLCFREYPTFISVHKCSSAVKSAFDDFSGSLGKLIGAIPSLEDECRSFSSTTSGIQRVRGKAALVLEHQDKLYDLLEIPQLMETCVRNGYYQEAMELLNHCHSLAERYPSVALVQDVSKEVEGILQLMMAQLLALLREPVKLPALVKTVSFLRRLNAMEESELGLVFISSRYYNFRTQLLSIERDKAEPIRYLRRYIDLFREHVYDIIAQFTAIFLESSPSDIAAVHITSFANQAITDLVNLVEAYIPRISNDSASMSSILVQLGYCAMSFSRVGLDFAPLISAPFTSTVLSTFSQSLATSSTEFSSILRDSAKAVLPPSQILVVPEYIPHIVSSNTSPPPLPQIDSVSYFPPLASLFNAHITAFNNLRLLAPLNLHSQLISLHSASLLASSSVLLQYVTQATTFTDEPTGKSKDRSGHARTPSAPRADLLRRNSEVQMTPEARAAKRREAKRVCVASVDVWCRMIVPFLVDKLNEGVFAELPKPPPSTELQSKLDELIKWVNENGEGQEVSPVKEVTLVNGEKTAPPPPPPAEPEPKPATAIEAASSPPRTPPPITRTLPVSSPPTFGSPFKASTISSARPDADDGPHTNGIDAVFESPRATASASASVLRSDIGVTQKSESTIPEPANLRDSEQETVEGMEAQLEAMNIGLTGEEAAVAVEIKHGSPLHKQTHLNNPHQELEVTSSIPDGAAKNGDGKQPVDEHPVLAEVTIQQPERILDVLADSATPEKGQPTLVSAGATMDEPVVASFEPGSAAVFTSETQEAADGQADIRSLMENGGDQQDVDVQIGLELVTASIATDLLKGEGEGEGEGGAVDAAQEGPTDDTEGNPVQDAEEIVTDGAFAAESTDEVKDDTIVKSSNTQAVDNPEPATAAEVSPPKPNAELEHRPDTSTAQEQQVVKPTRLGVPDEVEARVEAPALVSEDTTSAKGEKTVENSADAVGPDAIAQIAETETINQAEIPTVESSTAETDNPARVSSTPDAAVPEPQLESASGPMDNSAPASSSSTPKKPAPLDLAPSAPEKADDTDANDPIQAEGGPVADVQAEVSGEVDLDSPPPTASTEPSRPPSPAADNGNDGKAASAAQGAGGGGGGGNKKKKKKKKGKS
ncbi:hypothetical protein IAT40_001473 [Kwoniella sp. CBS 6097]